MILRRKTTVVTQFDIGEVDIQKLRIDLENNGFLEEIGEFETVNQLLEIIQSDSSAASFVFTVMINTLGYGLPEEYFLDDEEYDVIINN
jgi:hypothetical protein